MNQENVIAALEEKLHLKEGELAAAQADVDALRRSLSILRGQQSVLNEQRGETKEQTPMGMTSSLRSLFDQNPDRRWTPLQLREELTRMQRDGRFKTKSKDFFPALHGTLIDMDKRGIVKRDKRGDRITYRKAQ